jgi:ubiquinone/menaquinone biosynthesis C-methylase UbiE
MKDRMEYSQEKLESDGFLIKAAPVDSWRRYDELHPVPFYFDFDWLSARHPDLYHRFALSTVGLMLELEKLVDLSDFDVIDVGAGTGRSAIAASSRAKAITAVDIYESVVLYGMDQVHQAGLNNISYVRGDRSNLPFADNCFDALINSWAELSYPEAYRVLKPGGFLIWLGAPLEALCGELTSTLANVFPSIIQEVAPDEWFDACAPERNTKFEEDLWNGLPVTPPTLQHDFTTISEYGDYQEAAVIFGRLYGLKAKQYFLDRQQSHFAWRLRIEVSQVKK